jgi:hypothetical protein
MRIEPSKHPVQGRMAPAAAYILSTNGGGEGSGARHEGGRS